MLGDRRSLCKQLQKNIQTPKCCLNRCVTQKKGIQRKFENSQNSTTLRQSEFQLFPKPLRLREFSFALDRSVEKGRQNEQPPSNIDLISEGHANV